MAVAVVVEDPLRARLEDDIPERPYDPCGAVERFPFAILFNSWVERFIALVASVLRSELKSAPRRPSIFFALVILLIPPLSAALKDSLVTSLGDFI